MAAAFAAGGVHDESRTTSVTETASETRELRELEELYSILREAEALEAALSRNHIDTTVYRDAAVRLLRSYETQVSASKINIHAFMNDYNIKLPKATQLLVINKVPTTDLHASSDNRADALLCSETTGALITAMDTLRLGQTEVDQISPFMRGALESLNKHTWLGRDFEPRARLIEWLRKLNTMAASDSIDERDGRQLAHDLQQCYDGFISKLEEWTSKK